MTASSAPEPAAPGTTALERLLKRERTLTLTGLALLCALAWIYIWLGAGMGMSAWDMTRLSLFPHQTTMAPMPLAPLNPASALVIVAMWWAMMVAMMAPSAAPTILLYGRVHRHATPGTLAPTWAFVAGYLLAWLAFSLVTGALHLCLERAGAITAMAMGSQSRWLSAGLLIAVGLYQFTPLKQACLAHCRAPGAYLSRHWRPGVFGAIRLGALHGAYCVGCCWLLMALLFVGGVMNLVWIAVLTLLVLAEKVLPGGRVVGCVSGAALIAWGLATLLV